MVAVLDRDVAVYAAERQSARRDVLAGYYAEYAPLVQRSVDSGMSWSNIYNDCFRHMNKKASGDIGLYEYNSKERMSMCSSVMFELDKRFRNYKTSARSVAEPVRYSDNWYLSVFTHLCNDKKGMDDAGKVRFFESALRDGHYYLDGGRREPLWKGRCLSQDEIKNIVAYCTERAAKDSRIIYKGEPEERARQYEEKLAVAKRRIEEHRRNQESKKQPSLWKRVGSFFSKHL